MCVLEKSRNILLKFSQFRVVSVWENVVCARIRWCTDCHNLERRVWICMWKKRMQVLASLHRLTFVRHGFPWFFTVCYANLNSGCVPNENNKTHSILCRTKRQCIYFIGGCVLMALQKFIVDVHTYIHTHASWNFQCFFYIWFFFPTAGLPWWTFLVHSMW